jgi:hypothetical protein
VNAVGGVTTRGLSGRRAPAVGDNPVVLAVNKADLLPKDAHMDRVRNWVRATAKRLGSPRVVDVVLVRCLPARRWRCAAGRCLPGID